MLQIKNLSITHKKDLRVILNDFSCVLNDGDKAVIIGEEGNGKSTLLKWIYDEKLVDDYCETEGELIQTKERIAYLPQELPKEKRTLTVCEFFMEEESFLEQTPKTLWQMAAKFHVPADFFYREQPMETLSGGEKVKAQMMKLLLTEPTVLLLDEPSNDIDVETLEWLEQFIQNWKHIALFISHDETLIENTANMIIHIEQIRRKTVSRYTIAKMSYEQYRKERLRNFENQERQAESERREKKIREEKLKRIYQSVDYAQETISRQDPAGGRLLKKKMHAVKSMQDSIDSGAALDKMAEFVRAQVGDASYVYDTSKFPKTKYSVEVKAACGGFVHRILAENIGIACMTLGGGRETKDSVIDLSVGIYLKKKNGDAVDTGDTLAVIYANDREKMDAAAEKVLHAYEIAAVPKEMLPVVREYIYE